MATTKTIQPTGETITIPAMADQPDMSVVATDLGNITDAVNAQNQALSKVDTAHNFGQYTSLDTFKSDLLTFMQNVASFKTVAIQFVFTQTVEPFVAWSTFSGYAHCIQNGSTSLYFSCDVTSNNGEDISIGYSNGTWNIKKLADKVTTGTMVIACNAGKTQVSYANLPSGKPDSQSKFLQSLYQCVNHGSVAEMTTCCIDGVDLIIQTATAQNVTIRWFYFGTI